MKACEKERGLQSASTFAINECSAKSVAPDEANSVVGRAPSAGPPCAPQPRHDLRSNNFHKSQSLIHRALELGWIHKPIALDLKPESYLRRETRARWHAHGLNSSGKPRRNTPHPELANLDRKTYRRQYMRKLRNRQGKINAPNTQ